MPFRFPQRRGGGGGGLFGGGRRGGGGMGALKVRLAIGAVIALVVLVGYFMNTSVNPITGQSQRVGGIDEAQEVQMGLASMQQMAGEFGGESRDAAARAMVDRVGRRLLDVIDDVYPDSEEIPWEFSFTLLADDQTVNAFALPGGPTFITEALFSRLETEGQLAGVMGHEIGHVIHRHGLERMAKGKLLQGLMGAATVASGDIGAGQVLAVVGKTKMMQYGREDELECDEEGIKLMVEAGYDPRSMIGVMEILKEASGGASKAPEWQSSHPHPENRAEKIEQIIARTYPDGLPEGLQP